MKNPYLKGGSPPLIVLIFCLLAFGLRLSQVFPQSVWVDEAYSVETARRGVSYAFGGSWSGLDPNPPFYYILLWGWASLAGYGELSLSYLSILISVLTIPVLFKLGSALADRWVGTLAAALASLCSYYVWYGQNVRAYALVVFLAVVSVYLLRRLMDDPKNRRLALAFAFTATVGLYTHYGFVLLFPLYIGVLLTYRGWSGLLPERWPLLAVALPIVAFAPWAVHVAKLAMPSGTHSFAWGDMLSTVATQFSAGWGWPVNRDNFRWAPMLVVGSILLAVFGLLRSIWQALGHSTWRGSRRLLDVMLLIVWLTVPTILGITYFAPTDRYIFRERYIISASPAYLLLVSLGCASAARLFRPAGWALGIVAMGAVAATTFHHMQSPVLRNPEFRELATFVQRYEGPNDLILAMHDWVALPFLYYYKGSCEVRHLSTWLTKGEEIEQATLASQDGRRVWLLPVTANESPLEESLDSQMLRVHQELVEKARAVLYYPAPKDLEVIERHVSFGPEIELVNHSKIGGEVPAGGVLPLRLVWRAKAVRSKDYKVSVRLQDQERTSFLLDDRYLGAGDLSETLRTNDEMVNNYGLALAASILPGDYKVVVGIYDSKTGQTVPITQAEQATAQHWLELGHIQVVRQGLTSPVPHVAIGRPVRERIIPGLELLEVEIPPQASAGELLHVRLLWKVDGQTAVPARVVLQLRDVTGSIQAEWGETHLLRLWHSLGTLGFDGDTQDYADLLLPASLTAGRYRLEMLVGGDGSALEQHLLGSIDIRARQHSFVPPPIVNPTDVTWGDFARLIGYDIQLEKDTQGGTHTIHLELIWRAEGTASRNYKVFVHVLGSDGRIVAQHDGIPSEGTAVTSSWLSGEIVADPHTISLPPKVPGGTYTIEIGFYDDETQERLLQRDGSDHYSLLSFD